MPSVKELMALTLIDTFKQLLVHAVHERSSHWCAI